MATAPATDILPQARIIRPAAADAARPPGMPLDFNLRDVQEFAERLVAQARERVAALEAEGRALEASLAGRREALEREMRERRAEAEREVALWRDTHLADAQAAYREGFERGRVDGEAAGAAQGRAEGYRKGFEEGYGEGRQSGYREAHEAERARIAGETAPLQAALVRMAEEISSRRLAIQREARAELLPLAVEIARKVIKREVRELPDAVLGNVRKAIDLAFRRTALVVQVHPEDAGLVDRYTPEIQAAFSGLPGIAVEPREDVERGGCRVVAGSGRVDLTIEAQLELIEQALFARCSAQDPPAGPLPSERARWSVPRPQPAEPGSGAAVRAGQEGEAVGEAAAFARPAEPAARRVEPEGVRR